MRPIKFRVWSTRGEHRMIYLPTVLGGGMLKDLEEEDDWKVMQFTGLIDRDGTEIYESDIIRHPNGTEYPVEFHNGCFGLKGYIDAGQWHTFSTVSARTDECKVVGNIHEETP